VGANEKVARYAAISTGKVRFISYLIAGFTSGISAILLGGRLNSVSSTNAGMSYELDAIAAVIIGGTAMSGGRGNMWGTLVGVLILGIVGNVLDMWGVSVNLQGTVKGAVIIAAVLIQRKR
jgi:ribose transport system permease protein